MGLIKMGARRMEYKIDYKRELKGKMKEGSANEKIMLNRSVERAKLETGR